MRRGNVDRSLLAGQLCGRRERRADFSLLTEARGSQPDTSGNRPSELSPDDELLQDMALRRNQSTIAPRR
jgi:hypothetical protein